MDFVRIAARVASGAQVSVAWLEGGGYGPDDIVGALPPFEGPVWIGWHGFGWVATSQDPTTIPPETPVDEVVDTWGEIAAHEDLKEALADMTPWPSVAAFAADDQTIRWMCSYDDAEREGIAQALEEAGFAEAAARVPDVGF